MPAKLGDRVDPEETKILNREKSLKIPTPADFATKASRDALYRLNMKQATKNDTAVDTAKKVQAENKAKPFVFHKGGTVKKSGIALVKKGEKLMKKRSSKGPRKKV
ncbi:MAG: hypothetical protein ACREJN_21300 [Nitrospiraceae bacterium]